MQTETSSNAARLDITIKFNSQMALGQPIHQIGIAFSKASRSVLRFEVETIGSVSRPAGGDSGAGFIARAAAEVAGIVPADQRQTLGGPQQAVDGGVAELPGARGLQGLAGG